MSLRVGSLFTGYGGLDLAIGGRLAWYSEIDKAACQVLATHHPNVPNLGDITTIDWSTVEPVDIITGGYPCQPFSHAGKRKGKNDERHLWPYVLDAICAIRPRYAILENVSGHISLGFADVLADLAKVGLSAQWGTYRASDVGAPHRRERLFIVTYADGARRGEHGRAVTIQKELTAIEYDRDNAADTQHNGSLAGEGRRSLRTDAVSGWEQQQAGSQRKPEGGSGSQSAADTDMPSSETPSRRQGKRDAGRLQLVERGGQVTADTDNGHGQAIGGVQGLRGRHASRGDMPEVPTVENRSGTHGDTNGSDVGEIKKIQAVGAESSGVCGVDWGKYAAAIQRWEAVLDRPAPAPTTPGRNDRPRLNPQFVEWMMGLPDGWVTGHGLSAAQELKMLGNGVVPQQARAAITQLLERTQQ